MEVRPVDVDHEAELGYNLVRTREQLGASLQNPMLSQNEYETCVCDYVNAFQDMFFDMGNKASFTGYSDIASAISAQMYAMTEKSGSSFDVVERVKGYHEDEDALVLSATGFSATPRAVTLTLLDVIDDRLPKATSKRWDSESALS